jgi:hypothetical protein
MRLDHQKLTRNVHKWKTIESKNSVSRTKTRRYNGVINDLKEVVNLKVAENRSARRRIILRMPKHLKF